MGSARAPRAVFRALVEHNQATEAADHSGPVNAFDPTGEGAGQNTRRRVCSPKETEPLRLNGPPPYVGGYAGRMPPRLACELQDSYPTWGSW